MKQMNGIPAATIAAALLALPVLGAAPVGAQVETAEPLQVGAVAPDFELPAATRYGLLEEPVRLSDFEGKAVVLSFFYRARTKG